MHNPFTANNISSYTEPFEFIGLNLEHHKVNAQRESVRYLSQEQLQSFLLKGYLVLDPLLGEEYHRYVRDQAAAYFKGENDDINPGNNFLPMFPALQQLITDPVVHGALSTVLGESYELHPHRYCHRTFPGVDAQNWHTDSFWGYHKPVRWNRTRYAMIMYYPQKVRLENGPTWIKPGSQYGTINPKYYQGIFPNDRKEDHLGDDLAVELEEGQTVMIHYDLVHKGGKNMVELLRQMYKIQFVRVDEPHKLNPRYIYEWETLSIPKNYRDLLDGKVVIGEKLSEYNLLFDNKEKLSHERLLSLDFTDEESGLITSALESYEDGFSFLKKSVLIESVALNVHNWLMDTTSTNTDISDYEIESLSNNLLNDSEHVRYYAGNALARYGVVQPLLDLLLNHKDNEVKLNSTFSLASVPSNYEKLKEPLLSGLETEDQMLIVYIIYIFSEMGERALEIIDDILGFVDSTDKIVRLYVAESLGILGNHVEAKGDTLTKILNGLTQLMKDGDDHVRFTACLSVARIGTLADVVVDNLIDALSDHNRYVQGYAVMALKRIASPQAKEVLFEYLYYLRYDPITTQASQY